MDAGLEIWIDRQDIQAGNTWRVQIVQAIDTCDAFVLMLSPSSAASDNVRKEIDLAQDPGRTIFPIMLERVRLPAEIRYPLAGLQFVDIQMLGLEKAVNQLINTVQADVAKQKSLEEQKTHQAELVIQGIDPAAFDSEKQEQLLGFLAQLVKTSRSELKIAGLAAGSVHVFVDLPAEDAFELKTLALNRDKRFKKFGITALRLVGDKKFINIALGVSNVLVKCPIPIAFLWGSYRQDPDSSSRSGRHRRIERFHSHSCRSTRVPLTHSPAHGHVYRDSNTRTDDHFPSDRDSYAFCQSTTHHRSHRDSRKHVWRSSGCPARCLFSRSRCRHKHFGLGSDFEFHRLSL